MRICFVVNECSFFYSHRFELAKKLGSLAEVFVITDYENTDIQIIKKIQAANIKLQHVKKRSSTKGLLGLVLYFYRLLIAIKNIQPKAVFFVTLEISIIGVMVGWILRRVHSFYLITGFGIYLFGNRFKDRLFYAAYKGIFRSTKLNKNSKFIFQNLDDKERFINSGFSNQANCELIFGSGIQQSKKRIFDDNKHSAISFLFSSRLVVAKGITEFLEAARIIKKKYPEVQINISGRYDFNDADKISEELYKKINDLNYHGEIPHDEMLEYYYKSDIFVLPSYGEGLPKAALEAAASSMPLILSETSGCKECLIQKENGIFSEIKNAKSIVNAMEYFISNPGEIKRMGENSKDLINEKFSIEKISNSYSKLLSNIK